MGAVDLVPGVSGGTVALVLNIYPRLVASARAGSKALAYLVRGNVGAAREWLGRVDWSLVVPLLAGILVAVFSLASLLKSALANYPVPMAALFLGLVGGSVVVAWRLLERPGLRDALIALGSGAVLFALLGLSAGPVDREPPLWAFLGAGALAISAMILPGISGSFVLVMIGMYAPLLSAVADVDLLPVAVFAVGAVLGIAVTSRVLHWLLEHYYEPMVAIMVGLLLGSSRVLWPWPDGLDSTELGAPDEQVLLAVVLAVGGFALVVLLTRLSERLQHLDVEGEREELRS